MLIGCGRPFENNNLRLIDWTRGGHGHPHVFTAEDYDMLVSSDQLFARKFDENTDRQIIDSLCAHLLGKAE